MDNTINPPGTTADPEAEFRQRNYDPNTPPCDCFTRIEAQLRRERNALSDALGASLDEIRRLRNEIVELKKNVRPTLRHFVTPVDEL